MSSRRAPRRRSDRCRAPASSSSPPRPRSAASTPPTPTGATSGKDSRRPASCRALRRASTPWRCDPADQEYAPVAGLWELRETIAAHYNRVLPARTPLAVLGGERQRLGRRAGLADPRRGEPRADQPRPLPPGLHRVRGAARRLQGLHRHPHPARPGAGLRLRSGRAEEGDPRARALGGAALQPLQPHGQGGAGRGDGDAGSSWPAGWTARCSSTSSTRTTSGRRTPALRRRSAPRRTCVT